MSNQLIFRTMQWQDRSQVQVLCRELGYPVSAELLQTQLKVILKHPDHQLLVCLHGETVVGLAHLMRSLLLWSNPKVELVALVVAEPWRGRGIGKTFIERARDWGHDGSVLRVRCNIKRKKAHQFYLSAGFKLQKQQKVFDLTCNQHADHITNI